MKIRVSSKKVHPRSKPGQPRGVQIDYGDDGNSASVTHHYHQHPTSAFGGPGTPERFPSTTQHFTTREEAHHHAAQKAGVDSALEDIDSDAGEEAAEEQPTMPMPGKGSRG